MDTIQTSEQPRELEGTAPFAGFWRRLAAFAIDGLILGIPALILGLAMFRFAASLGQGGRIVGFTISVLYFGLMDSRLGSGQTLGKRLLRIRVVDRSGAPLSPLRSSLRFLVIGVPYFLNGLWFSANPATAGWLEYLLGTVLIFAVFGGLGAIAYLFIFNRRTRQSLHDLAVDSFVVRVPAAPIPFGIRTPRLHLVVVGAWFAIALVAPAIGLWAARNTGMAATVQPLADLQTTIKSQVDVRNVMVTAGSTTVAMISAGTTTTSYLMVSVQPAGWDEELDDLQLAVARIVLDAQPDLLGKQVLIVRVQRQFDLGIASWSTSVGNQLDAAKWREKLMQQRSSRPNT